MYVVTALLQGTLLSMGVYFEYINPKKAETVKDATSGEDAEESGDAEGEDEYSANGDTTGDPGTRQRRASEQTPLLQGSS